MVGAVPLPARLEPFLVDRRERLAERVDERRGDRVVILAVDPVVFEQL
jgi:hypothetical protein